MPDLTVNGLRGSGIHEDGIKAMLQRPLVVLLGTADTDPKQANLRRTPEAMAQGLASHSGGYGTELHRFARGQNFYATGQRQAAALGVPPAWKLETAVGVGHVDKKMAPFAVAILFGRHAPIKKESGTAN